MSERVIVESLAVGYETAKASLKESLGMRDGELAAFFSGLYGELQREDHEYVSDAFVAMLEAHRVDPKVLVFMAITGVEATWEEVEPGLSLLLEGGEDVGPDPVQRT